MEPIEFVACAMGIVAHALIGMVVGRKLGTRYNHRSYKSEFRILSKVDFFRIISLSTLWQLTLLGLCVKQIIYYCNKALKYWRALPFHNPQ